MCVYSMIATRSYLHLYRIHIIYIYIHVVVIYIYIHMIFANCIIWVYMGELSSHHVTDFQDINLDGPPWVKQFLICYGEVLWVKSGKNRKSTVWTCILSKKDPIRMNAKNLFTFGGNLLHY